MDREEFTRRDLGTGLAFLGGMLLVMTGFMYVMAHLNEEQYGLFAGRFHLTFYTVLGSVFMLGGILLARRKRPES